MVSLLPLLCSIGIELYTDNQEVVGFEMYEIIEIIEIIEACYHKVMGIKWEAI